MIGFNDGQNGLYKPSDTIDHGSESATVNSLDIER
jgi:hypothetical protein